ncbi:hypothetical protein CVIRNUC_008540 [Coccomyxa viridis]|uniref:Uncharacterized protein n=1 Tax=Coccomyxa viridis TaxID=1274662 RepID=A0AAV1IDJ3_9CHLO|nr:hypothetical protein CVIRNUC_008540 [Coccomyxa viridis]
MALTTLGSVRSIGFLRLSTRKSFSCVTGLVQHLSHCQIYRSCRAWNVLHTTEIWHLRDALLTQATNKRADQGTAEQSTGGNEDFYIHALLLLFFASQNRPLVATRGFVEVVLEMFLQGISLSEMEAMMAVARLESGGQLVGDLDQEVMLSWAAMVFLTLQAIGLPMTASGEGRRARAQGSASAGQMERGMASFVRQTISMYRGGFDSRRMLLTQSLADATVESGSMSAGTKYMQQNTRLVVLTLEAVRESGMRVEAQLEPSVLTSAAGEDSMSSGSVDMTSSSGDSSSDEGPPLPPPAQFEPTQWHTSAEAPEPSESADADRAGSDWGASTSGRQPVDFIFGFLPEARKQELAAGRGATVHQMEVRSTALRLFMAFIGAQAKSLYAVQAFIKQARRCYGKGWSVQELYEQLTSEEKYQGTSGGALQVRTPNPADQQRLSGHVFAQWLSIAYMTFAQMGAPPGHGNENKTGWAWIDTQPGQHLQILEAYRLADLVGNTLRLQAERDAMESGKSLPASSAAEAALREHFSGEEGDKAVQQQVEESGSIVVVEDPSLRQTSPMLVMISQFTGLVKLGRDLILSERETA